MANVKKRIKLEKKTRLLRSGFNFLFWLNLSVSHRINASLFLIFAHSFVTNDAVNKREERIVFADTYVRAGMNFRASLANENITRENCLTVAALCAKTFSLAVSSVVGRTRTFLMSE